MATPILNKLSKDLAYKLQDPVSAGTANGVRLSASERLTYILRAYRRFLRLITMLYPNLIQKLFQSYYSQGTGTTDTVGKISTLGYAEVFDIYCREPDDEDYFKALFIAPNLYYDIQDGQNSFYTPDLNTNMYYWTQIESEIFILPAVTLQYKILYRMDIASLIENQMSGVGYGGAKDIDVPTEHLDLILSLASSEAYTDIGQPNMVQMYLADVNYQLGILNTVAKQKEKDDDKDSA